MKKIKLIAIILVLFSTFLAAVYAADKDISPYQKPDKPIMLTPQMQTFSIRLESNPSTGYSWFLKSYDNQMLKPVSHQFVKSGENMPGKSGYEIWTFQANQEAFVVPQSTTVNFVLMRPWEKQVVKSTNFTVIFAATP